MKWLIISLALILGTYSLLHYVRPGGSEHALLGFAASRIASQSLNVPQSPPAAPVVRPGKLQISELNWEGPTWYDANRPLYYTWKHPGGDWRDSQNASQGPAHYGSATATQFGEQPITISGLGALVTRLIDDNTGIYIRQANGGIPSKVASKENKTGKPIPTLTVTTDQGTFRPPLTHDLFLDVTTNYCLGALEYVAAPMILKFDLSGIKGKVQNASLTMHIVAMYQAPVVLAAYYLDMPHIITDPATQIGGAAAGLRGTVAEQDLATHPAVLIYSAMDPKKTPKEWINYKRGVDNVFKQWPEFGVGAVRLSSYASESRGQITTLASWRHWTQPVQRGKPYSRDFGKGYEELWLSYTLMIDPDVKDGINELGVKLPGMEGVYDNVGHPNHNGSLNHAVWSGRLEHSNKSPANPHVYRLIWYWYGADNPVNNPNRGAIPKTDVSLLAGQIYSIEQHIKLNTFNPQTQKWNHDGVRAVFVDGVRVFYDPKSYIRAAAVVQIQDVPFLNVYHGGSTSPSATIHYELGPVVVATQYIGALKKVPRGPPHLSP